VNEPRPVRRPPRELLEPFHEFGTAAISSALRERCGILRAFLVGPVAFTPGLKAVGSAITLSFLPKREDIVPGHDEETGESTSALWSAVIAVQDGDVLVVDARGNLQTGCLGDMLMTAVKAKGGRGLVVDGCVRDTPHAKKLGLPLFLRGATPHNAGHFEMYPWSWNVPVGCGGVLVLPGDIIVGDDDGVVVVPPKVAPEVIAYCRARETREVFERMKLQQTGDIARYYPFSEEGKREYEEWLRATGRSEQA
jgi:regulator of RNase E activity RraA